MKAKKSRIKLIKEENQQKIPNLNITGQYKTERNTFPGTLTSVHRQSPITIKRTNEAKPVHALNSIWKPKYSTASILNPFLKDKYNRAGLDSLANILLDNGNTNLEEIQILFFWKILSWIGGKIPVSTRKIMCVEHIKSQKELQKSNN